MYSCFSTWGEGHARLHRGTACPGGQEAGPLPECALRAAATLPGCRAYGAAAIMAGVAAQYLQLHPQAGPDEVKAALLAMATPDAITNPGVNASTAALTFTELQAPDGSDASSSDEGSGLSAGSIAGIAVGAAAAGKVTPTLPASWARARLWLGPLERMKGDEMDAAVSRPVFYLAVTKQGANCAHQTCCPASPVCPSAGAALLLAALTFARSRRKAEPAMSKHGQLDSAGEWR